MMQSSENVLFSAELDQYINSLSSHVKICVIIRCSALQRFHLWQIVDSFLKHCIKLGVNIPD